MKKEGLHQERSGSGSGSGSGTGEADWKLLAQLNVFLFHLKINDKSPEKRRSAAQHPQELLVRSRAQPLP